MIKSSPGKEERPLFRGRQPIMQLIFVAGGWSGSLADGAIITFLGALPARLQIVSASPTPSRLLRPATSYTDHQVISPAPIKEKPLLALPEQEIRHPHLGLDIGAPIPRALIPQIE